MCILIVAEVYEHMAVHRHGLRHTALTIVFCPPQAAAVVVGPQPEAADASFEKFPYVLSAGGATLSEASLARGYTRTRLGRGTSRSHHEVSGGTVPLSPLQPNLVAKVEIGALVRHRTAPASHQSSCALKQSHSCAEPSGRPRVKCVSK